MAGENRQDSNRPSHERMTEQKQEAERGLNIGSEKTQQQEQQGQRPQRKPDDRAGGSVQDASPNPSRSQQSQSSDKQSGGQSQAGQSDQNRRRPQGEPQRQPRGEEEDASGKF